VDDRSQRFPVAGGHTLRNKGLLILAVPLGFQIAFALVLMAMERSASRQHEAEVQAQRTVASTYHLLQLLVDTETAIRGYVITEDRRFLEPYDRAIRDVPAQLRSLEASAANLSSDVPGLRAAAQMILEYQTLQRDRVASGQRDEAARVVRAGNGKRLMDGFRVRAAQFNARYSDINESRSVRSAAARRNLRDVVLAGLMMNIIAAASLFVYFARGITRRLAVVVDNTFRIERREPLHGLVGGGDEIAELDARVHGMAAALENSRRELESFSYSVSHDLRAPLRAVSGYARMVEEDFAERLDGEGRRYLTTIRAEASRMGRLIDDLLAFSRLGRQPLQVAPVDVAAIAREALTDIPEAADPRVSVHIDAPPAVGDRAMLRQVFVNLLSNAIKFSSQSAEIRVEVGGSHGNGENVYWVRDYGVGFDMKYAGKLFGVFQRLHAAHEFEGTGVGLAIVRRVIERHGGRVWADAEEGRGACFSFTLANRKEKER